MTWILSCAGLGLVTALVARGLLPGHPAAGWFTSALLGPVGGWLAALAGQKMGLYRPPQKVGLLLAILGAMAFLLIYSVILR